MKNIAKKALCKKKYFKINNVLKYSILLLILFTMVIACNKNQGSQLDLNNRSLEERAIIPPYYPSRPAMYVDGVLTNAEIQSFMVATRNTILSKYGIDLYSKFGSNDAAIATIGLLLPVIEYYSTISLEVNFSSSNSNPSISLKNSLKITPNFVNPPRGDAVYCAAEALGVGAVFQSWAGKAASWIAQQAINAIIKDISRGIPIVGWGLAGWDFGSCMGWV